MMETTPQKNVFQYDTSGNLTNSWNYEKEEMALPWSLSEWNVYTYDDLGHALSDTLFSKDLETGRWMQREIHEYRYDTRGRMLMENRRHRFLESDPWKGDYQTDYQYDDKGRVTQLQTYAWSGDGIWTLSSKRVSFNDGTRDTASYVYSYVKNDDSWTLKSKDVFLSDSNGLNYHCLTQKWYVDSLCWSVRRKTDFAFDHWGNKIREYAYDLDTTTYEWVQDYGEEWLYDEHGNLLSNTSVFGRSAWIFWGVTMKTVFRYNYSVESKDAYSVFLPVEGGTFNLITGGNVFFYMPSLDAWYESANMTCYYSDLAGNPVPTRLTKESSWYFDAGSKQVMLPASANPVTVQVFDLQGRMLLNIKASERVSLENMGKGLYLIRLVTKDGVRQGKVFCY